MRKRSKIILVSVLTLGVAGGAIAYTAAKHCDDLDPKEKVAMINERITDRLELHTEQQAKLGALTSRAAEIIAEAKSQQAERDALIEALLNEESVDQAALLDKVSQKTALVNDKAPEMVALFAGFVDSLNTEQKAEVREFIEHKRNHRGWGRH